LEMLEFESHLAYELKQELTAIDTEESRRGVREIPWIVEGWSYYFHFSCLMNSLDSFVYRKYNDTVPKFQMFISMYGECTLDFQLNAVLAIYGTRTMFDGTS
jgi:hypothetical protein